MGWVAFDSRVFLPPLLLSMLLRRLEPATTTYPSWPAQPPMSPQGSSSSPTQWHWHDRHEYEPAQT